MTPSLAKSYVKPWVRGAIHALPEGRLFDRLHALAFFRVAHGRWPRRDSGLFNDRLYHYKTTAWSDDPLRLRTSDKEEAKVYGRSVLGRDLAPRTLALLDAPGAVTPEALPAPSVIKPTHLSGPVIFHHGDRPLRPDELAEIRSWFGLSLYGREMRTRNYRAVRPRVIAEEVVAGPDEIRDYKVFCWQGRPRAIQVDIARHSAHRRRLYTTDWTPLEITYNYPQGEPEPRPGALDEMLDAATRLSAAFDFIRIDFFHTPGRIWLGEFSHVPENANGRFGSRAEERQFHDLVFGAA